MPTTSNCMSFPQAWIAQSLIREGKLSKESILTESYDKTIENFDQFTVMLERAEWKLDRVLLSSEGWLLGIDPKGVKSH